MAQQSPRTPPTRVERARNYLAYGFGLSLLFHLIVGPFVHFERTNTAEEQQPKEVTVSRIPTPPPTPPPTPTPKPTPPPTPPPKETPPPKQTPQPKQPQIKINTAKTESKGGNSGSEQSNTHTTGSEQGIPQGVGTAAPVTAPPATPVPATPKPTPPPTPTPASCAVPNADARTVNAVQVDTPPMAQSQGISGEVQVKVSLNAASQVTAVDIIKSPSALLNNAAKQAARQSTFKTKIVNCQPVADDYIFVVDFQAQ